MPRKVGTSAHITKGVIMFYETVEGDLLKLFEQGEFDAIVHGCNCFHSMSGGIARVIASRYPQTEEADLATNFGDPTKLGQIDPVTVTRDDLSQGIVINAYTQYNPGADFNYDAIRKVFFNLSKYVRRQQIDREFRLGVPAIGSGIAGGDWEVISQMVSNSLVGTGSTLVEYRP
jgi:O-acetyl-ADP-ribose deacetylase (regulator of RNase III)